MTLVRVLALGLILIVLAGVLAGLNARGTAAPAREILLVARNMAFHLEGGNGELNPTLQVRAGERVRIVVRNEERGVTHNFAVPGWKIQTPELRGSGTTAVEFVVPAAAGRQTYECTPHAAMMRGTIEVR